MRKLFYLGFCLALVTGFGCAITDYGLITDNDQTRNGQGTGVVNTNGHAHIFEASQVATLWPDGADESIWFVDQKANGDQTLFTYTNFSSAYPIFHDDMYCNPDWQGCANVTADNPLVGDVDIFDYTWNPSCPGSRSLSVLVSSSRYYGECGRAKLDLGSQIQLTNMGRLGRSLGVEGLFYDLSRTNTSIFLNNNAGQVVNLAMTADAQAFAAPTARKATINMQNPLAASMGRAYADFLANQATHATTVTLTYNGVSMSWNIGGNTGISNPSTVLANVNAHY